MGSTCRGGGAGREALRAVTMTAQFLLTILLDFKLFLPLVAARSTSLLISLYAENTTITANSETSRYIQHDRLS